MKCRIELVTAKTSADAALTVMQVPWNQKTKDLVKRTFKLDTSVSSLKTGVFTATWNEANGPFKADIITAYVQVYDEELNLYQVTTQH